MPVSVFVGIPRIAAGVLDAAAPRVATAFGLGARRAPPPLFSRALSFSAAAATCMLCHASRQAARRKHALRKVNSLTVRLLSTSVVRRQALDPKESKPAPAEEIHESPYTLPNALTLARIASCPFLAYSIVHGNFEVATGLLVAGGFTDWLDGYLARKWNQKSVLGSVLDPMADKTLMTTLVVTLTYKGLLPLPLALLIFGRDFALSMWAMYVRYISVPPPVGFALGDRQLTHSQRTLKRYLDLSVPTAEINATQISKVNTALQLVLMGATTVSPLISAAFVAPSLEALQWIVAVTTIWSGVSYLGAAGFKMLKPPKSKPKA
ncbi:uncharacterized protein EHS24_000483 [Apiotrichum porosum]|uniref:Cardiolipin synthase n=1 Tax=Apiotrichum porosum TaxID=105984 RepID=A0A427Y9X3_9TREE|nr:uncharacterized protein EHS24_000483 [Apiotrichum porosum]RSH87960.1 hypothetical protein EHS24_000483 [Apiotrichum porosum]